MGEYAEVYKNLCSTAGKVVKVHEELGPARMARDLADVCIVEDFIRNHCQDPFDLDDVPEKLSNIVSGQIASDAVQKSLGALTTAGKTAFEEFVVNRLVEGSGKSFWDAIQRRKILTFSDMKRKLEDEKGKQVVIDPEVLFRRLLAVSKQRDVDLKKVLSFELAPVAPAMFHKDGAMRKTTRSDLATKLESVCKESTELPHDTHGVPAAYIIDGMGVIQALNDNHFKTFNDLAEVVLKRVIRVLRNPDFDAGTVTLVFDQYWDLSIKSGERQRRGTQATQPVQTHQIIGSRDVPHFRQFLKVPGNKSALVTFVCDYIMKQSKERIPNDKMIVIAGGLDNGEEVVAISNNSQKRLTDLYSSQEEADTRMVLHAINLSSHFSRTIIRTDDTDVLVLLLHYKDRGLLSNEVYMHAGHSGRYTINERFIPIHSIASKLGSQICQCLPAAHALTGCDSTNAMFGIGKKTMYAALERELGSSQSDYGLANVNDPKWMEAARYLIIAMYKSKNKKKCRILDELRHHLATTTDKLVVQLPPTEDAFREHALRARFQTLIWCRSHIPKPELDDPTKCGWFKDENGLHPVMFKQEAVPKEIRDLSYLYCRDGHCRDDKECTCLQAGLKCIDICECQDCPNQPIINEVIEVNETL